MSASTSRTGGWLTRERVALAALLLLAGVVRGGVLIAMFEKLRDDPDAYRQIAENLLRHTVYAMGDSGDLGMAPEPTAYRPPLYPVVLANLPAADGLHVSLVKVAGLHWLLGVATVWLTWLTARRLVGWAGPTHSETRPGATSWWADPGLLMPLVAGVIVAGDPILLNQSALVMTETLATFLAILALWCLARFDGQRSWFNAALAGGAMGLAVLCRPTFLPWVGLVAVGMLLVRGRIANCKLQIANCKFGWSDIGWRVANSAALVGAAAIIVSPWVIRNQRVLGKPIVTTTHGGYTLWLGNNESFYQWLRANEAAIPWQPDRDVPPTLEAFTQALQAVERGENQEIAEDAIDRSRAIDAIRADRVGFARACLYRLGQLWSPLPNQLAAEESTGRRLLRYAVAAWYCGVSLLAAVGAWRLRWKLIAPPWLWGLLLCLVFTGVHTFYWSNLRMRAPLMPFVALVAAAGMWTSAPRQASSEK